MALNKVGLSTQVTEQRAGRALQEVMHLIKSIKNIFEHVRVS